MSWELFPLHVFPEGSLASSVITTVWVGVAVVAFFNLRFGWSLAGLVVPGYLVPLLLIKPWSVAVIIGEGMVTYLVVQAISVLGARYLGLADFFGRDRFFALVLTSVIVRVAFDAFWLPGLGAWVNQTFSLDFDYANNLHSFGLIIVALIANNFWKPGLVRGTFWLLVILAVTFVGVRFGLMALTNFSVSSLSYLYEDVASSLLASPKAYIILLTTAFVASRMNLHYAWEFNGILIPSLLALQWYQPTKLLLTFVEVAVILIAVHLVMKLPVFRHINLSGARKLFFFFSIAFAYKLLLGYSLELLAPRLNVTDYFAFGYLISTLLALKIHDKDIGIRVTRATLQTSLTAVIMASLVGFALSFIHPAWEAERTNPERLAAPERTDMRLETLLLRQRVNDYAVVAKGRQAQPNSTELAQFKTALTALRRYREAASPVHLEQARRALIEVDYALVRAEQDYLVAHEKGTPRGWGLFVFNMRAESGLLIEVPAAIDEQGTAETGLALLRDQQALALAVNHPGQQGDMSVSADVTRNPGSFFHQFHQTFGPRNTLQVRLMPAAGLDGRKGDAVGQQTFGVSALPGVLMVKQQLPDGLRLQSLERLTGKLTLRWEAPGTVNVQRERTPDGFAELYLTPDALRPLLARQGVDDPPARLITRDGALSDYLQGRLDRMRDTALETAHAFRRPRLEEVLFFDREVLTPLHRLMTTHGHWESWPEDSLNRLRYLDSLARGLGYRLVHFHERFHERSHDRGLNAQDAQDHHYVILENTASIPPSQPWSLVVVRTGMAQPHFVQVPRPRYERNTLAAGVMLFQRLGASALLLAGSHPYLDPQGKADVLSPANPRTLFNLIHQVWVREQASAPQLITQVRGMGESASVQVPSLLAFREGLRPEASALPLRESLRSTLDAMGLSPREVLGGEDTAGYEVGSSAQTAYLSATRQKDFALVWMTPDARRAFERPANDRQQQLQFRALDIDTREISLVRQLQAYDRPPSSPPKREVSPLEDSLEHSLEHTLEHYVDTADIVALRDLQQRGHRLLRVLDPDSRQAFLLLFDARDTHSLLAVANLNPLSREVVTAGPDRLNTTLERFVERRAFLLHWGGGE